MDGARETVLRLADALANLDIKQVLIAAGVITAALAMCRALPDRTVTPAFRRWMLENGQVALAVLVVIFLVLRPHVFQAFYIPSPSMLPTFHVDDRLVVNKLIYRFTGPRRGDIVVFRAPEASRMPEQEFIKRVIGLPGDEIEVTGWQVTVDGRPLLHLYEEVAPLAAESPAPLRGILVAEPRIEIRGSEARIERQGGPPCRVILGRTDRVRLVDGAVQIGERTYRAENGMPLRPASDAAWGGDPGVRCRSFVTDEDPDFPALVVAEGSRLAQQAPAVRVNGRILSEPYLNGPIRYVMPPVTVPPGHYFVLGDNRNDSHDSHAWGFLARERILGRAEITFWPVARVHVLNGWLLYALALYLGAHYAVKWLLARREARLAGRIALLEE